MIKSDERKPQIEQRHVERRVSSAVWPVKTRKGVPTGKAAQRRRDWIVQGRWWIILVDALSMRALLVLTTILVVTTSLLVAILGLHFWYLLPLPLLLFTMLLVVPLFLASRKPVEITPSALPFTQEMRSSSGFISQYAHELKSSAGMLSQYAHELRSEPGLLTGHSPATPMPTAQPLVRVLETYDLRSTQVEHFLGEQSSDTIEHACYLAPNFWGCANSEFPQEGPLPFSQLGPDPAFLDASCPGELSESLGKHE